MTDNLKNDDDIEIEIDDTHDDVVVESDGESVVAVEPEPVKKTERFVSADEGIEEVKRQLEAERANRIEAERRAREAATEAQKAKGEVEDTQIHLINNAIDTIKRNTELVKREYSQAMASGDYDRAADLQQDMSTNAAKLIQLESGKQAMESRPRNVQQIADPVERLASQVSVDYPRSGAWLRSHPEYVTDPKLNRKMVAAHEIAVADGLRIDSDEYFSAVENILRIAPRSVAKEEPERVSQKRSAPPAAPVTRSSTPTSGSRPIVRLTKDERDIADMNKMTYQEYAKHKLAIQREQSRDRH